MKLKNKILYFLSLLLCLLVVIIGPQFFHPWFYKIEPKYHCDLYKNYSSVEILNIFSKTDNYTINRAADFFTECNNKNAAPLIYRSALTIYNPNDNPFNVIPLPYIINDDSVVNANNNLSRVLSIPPAKLINTSPKIKLESYSNYWEDKIKQK